MRVCITGGSGFIGQNLMIYLAETEPDTEIVILDVVPPKVPLSRNAKFVYADIRNMASLLTPFEGCDEIYHLAGILGTSELIAVSSLACEVNVAGANNVMDAARICGVKRVYNVAKPHFESYSENSYTLTKHAGELVGQLYAEKYGMEVATVRWLNAVGPHQHLYPVRKFLPMMILLALFNYPLEVYGDGLQTIDPIDTRDLSRFTVHAVRNLGTSRTVVDLGSGCAINCTDAAHLIADIVSRKTGKSKVPVVHLPMREGEKPGVNLVADMSYWDSVGMKPEYDFEASVGATLGDIVTRPQYELQNALRFYGKV